MIVNELWLDTLALLDEYSESGVLVGTADTKDMELKFIRFANKGLKELSKLSRFTKKVELANKVIPNLLGSFEGFALVDYLGTPQYLPNEQGVIGGKAYYIETDGDNGGIEIQELQSNVWVTIKTTTYEPTVTSLTPYSGVIPSISPNNAIRIKLTGSTHYRHANRFMTDIPFSVNKIPQYRPWVKLTLPLDFGTLVNVVEEFSERQYSYSVSYKMEGMRDFYYNYFFEGNMRIVYKPIPKTITLLTDTIECDDITAEMIPFYAATFLAPFENKELPDLFNQKYDRMKQDSFTVNPALEQSITDVLQISRRR